MGGLFSSNDRRIVSTEEVRLSISQDDMHHLTKVYSQLKRNDTLSHSMFRRTFLPANTPMQFSQKLYDVYASSRSSKEMNFDDFLEVYYLVHFDSAKAHKSVVQRRAQLYFHIFKQHGGSSTKNNASHDNVMKDYFNSNLFVTVGTQYFNMTDQQVNQKVTLQRFLVIYEQSKSHKLFKWMHEFESAYKGDQNAQIDLDQIQKQMQIEGIVTPKTKSEINQQLRQNLKSQTEANSTPLKGLVEEPVEEVIMLDPTELKVLERFFHERLVAKHDMKQSFKELEHLFEGFKLPPLLQRKIIESFVLSSETNYFELKTFIQIMTILTKHGSDEDCLIGYIFDIFSKYKDVIHKEQLIKIVETLGDLPEEEVKVDHYKVQTLQKSEFIQLCKKLGIRLHYFSKLSTLFVVEFELKPNQPEVELEAIRLCLDGETDLKQYMQKSLGNAKEGDVYYIMNKKFWLTWSAYVGLKEKDVFGSVTNLNKKQSSDDRVKAAARKPVGIMNEQLRKTVNSTHLNPNLIYWKDYVVVPSRVWKAFVNWYGRSYIIMRRIIIFPQEHIPLRTSVQIVAHTDKEGAVIQQQVQKGYEQLMFHDSENRMVTELEIEEVYLKCGRIQENGKVPPLVKDGFFSRKSTLQNVLQQLVNAFENKVTKDQHSQEFRFWDSEDGPLNDEFLQQTIEESGLKSGQKVFVEFKLEKGQWPFEKEGLMSARDASQTKGCANLGNTCYMNASLQCLVNAPYMREFFTGIATPNGINKSVRLKKGDQRQYREGEPRWRIQMNPNNALGRKGEFVKPYAETVEKMWDSGAYFSVYPWGFKRSLGKVNTDFQGIRQHDAHEFVSTTLGTLHEELNVRQKKPYIENPEFRPDRIELSYEFWSNFLQRDWSFLVFLFYGQIKSTIECQKCFSAKVMYDPFSVISLPVPNANSLLLPVIVDPLPTELRKILHDQLNIVEGIAEEYPDEAELPMRRQQSLSLTENIESFLEKQKRQRAIHVQVNVDQGDTVGEMVKTLHQMSGLNLIGKVNVDGQEIELTKLIIYVLKDSRKQNITLLFEDQRTFEEIGVMDKQALVAAEVLTEAAKQLIQKHHYNIAGSPVPTKTVKKDTQLLRTRSDYLADPIFGKSMTSINQVNPSLDSVSSSPIKIKTLITESAPDDLVLAQSQSSASIQRNRDSHKSGVISPLQYFNIFYKNKVPTCDLIPNYQPPSELVIMVINRKLLLREQTQILLKRHDPICFGAEFPVLATESSSGRELYELVWMRVRAMLQLSVHDRSMLWWDNCTNADEKLEFEKYNKTLTPFVLKHVDFSGTSCSICHWSKKCHGCIIQPSETDATQLRKVLLRNTYIACEWDVDFFDTYNDPQSQNWQEHISVQQISAQLDKPYKLSDCMELFQRGDMLRLKCNNCNSNTQNNKKLKIQASPPVLVIHLKRFRMTAYQTLKMQNMITFPLYDFDLSEYVAFQQPGATYQYDLFGIVNHFGSMNGGHYIGVVKNERTSEWLQYDDLRCTQLTEDQVQTKAAYILFYRRKDLVGKELSDIIPTLNETKFPGMPIRTKYGKVGYLIEYREFDPCPYVVGLGPNTVLYLSENSIIPDPDTEDLSSINSKFKKKWKDPNPEDFTAKGRPDSASNEPVGKGKTKTKKKNKDDDKHCSLF